MDRAGSAALNSLPAGNLPEAFDNTSSTASGTIESAPIPKNFPASREFKEADPARSINGRDASRSGSLKSLGGRQRARRRIVPGLPGSCRRTSSAPATSACPRCRPISIPSGSDWAALPRNTKAIKLMPTVSTALARFFKRPCESSDQSQGEGQCHGISRP